MADANRHSPLGADFSRRSPFTRRCVRCVDHLRFDASFRPAPVGVPSCLRGARLTFAPLSVVRCDCVSAGGRVTVWCGHQLAGHRPVGSRALAGRVVHARTRTPQPASSDFNALLDRFAWLFSRLAVRSACCTKADLASGRLGSTSIASTRVACRAASCSTPSHRNSSQHFPSSDTQVSVLVRCCGCSVPGLECQYNS